PNGRKPASSMSLGTQADALVAFHFDDLRPVPDPAPAMPDTATYRTFDGQVFEFRGRRDGDKAYITVAARRDPQLAAQFPKPTATEAIAKGEVKVTAPPEPAPDEAADRAVDRINERAAGVEFEIPVYKYEAI